MNMHAVKSKHGFQCPFCKGVIQEDTARFGGNCPHCMLEIPGDEAPTDPGAILRIKKQNEEKQAQAWRRRRNIVIGVAATMFLGLVSLVGIWQYTVYQDSLVYELEDYYQTPIDQIASHKPKEVVVEPEATPTATPTKRPVKPVENGGNTGGGNIPATGGDPVQPTDGVADAAGNPDLQGTGVTSTAKPVSTSTDPFAGLGPPARAAPLDDNAQINSMVGRIANAYQPRVDTCVSQQTKQDENFTGSWRVQFTILPTGEMKAVDITPKGKPNPDFEACLERNMMKWKFEKITHEFKTNKSYNF